MPLYNGCVKLQSLAWVSPTSLFQLFLLVLVTWGKHLGEHEGPEVGVTDGCLLTSAFPSSLSACLKCQPKGVLHPLL